MSPHRFVDPTPTGAERVRFTVADWEIECCAPPPVVGEPTSWLLGFTPAGDRPDPLLDEQHDWTVDAGGVLHRGPVSAHWSATGSGSPPPVGPARLHGRLRGTVHGGDVPDDLPRTTGRVDRIRLLRQEYRLVGDRTWEPVPGTLVAEDLQEGPRWFGPGELGAGARPFGLLLDVVPGWATGVAG